jgi:hypothetical protein
LYQEFGVPTGREFGLFSVQPKSTFSLTEQNRRLCRKRCGETHVEDSRHPNWNVSANGFQCVGRASGSLRKVNILLDRSGTEALTIYSWAVDTSEGVIAVNTGETG